MLSGRPCHPSFCGVFHAGPCFPQYLPPFGEDLRLTIVSTDDNAGDNMPAGASGKSGDNSEAEAKPLDAIGELYAALRACWVPPSKGAARHGMEYTIRFAFKRNGAIVAPPFVTYASRDVPAKVRDTYRDAVNDALTRCTPAVSIGTIRRLWRDVAFLQRPDLWAHVLGWRVDHMSWPRHLARQIRRDLCQHFAR